METLGRGRGDASGVIQKFKNEAQVLRIIRLLA
jgi:hypothetical protein